jgi:hypothetical protein
VVGTNFWQHAKKWQAPVIALMDISILIQFANLLFTTHELTIRQLTFHQCDISPTWHLLNWRIIWASKLTYLSWWWKLSYHILYRSLLRGIQLT